MEELDNEPTVEELSKAIGSLASGKAHGNDAIPPEVIKYGKRALLLHLHELLCLCWNELAVPPDIRDAKIRYTKTKVIAAIAITTAVSPKSFDLVSRNGLFKTLEKIGCPLKLPCVISSFHDNMKRTVMMGLHPNPLRSAVE